MSKNTVEITKKEYKELRKNSFELASLAAFNYYLHDIKRKNFHEYIDFSEIAKKHDLTYEDFYMILVINKIIKRDFFMTGEVYGKYKGNINTDITWIGCDQYALITGSIHDSMKSGHMDFYIVFTNIGVNWVEKNIEKWTSKYLLHKLSQ